MGLDEVLGVVVNVAKSYCQKYGKVPVVCIDSIDLLAKRDKQLCETLIALAKVLANRNLLELVLKSSEGAIMPFLEVLSTANRADVYEIGDLSEEKAVSFLMKIHMSVGRAKKLVQCVGGRLVYLQSSLNKNHMDWQDDEVCKKIKAALFGRKLKAQKVTIFLMKPESQEIIDELHKHSTVSIAKLINKATNKIQMKTAIKEMIDSNILRYNINGDIKWHGKVQLQTLRILSRPAAVVDTCSKSRLKLLDEVSLLFLHLE